MALIKCPECGKDISDKAVSCIHCGYPLSATPISVVTENESYEMEAPCLRLKEGQLYAPKDGFCKNLRMKAFYYEHNNFIDIASDTEHIPVPHQP